MDISMQAIVVVLVCLVVLTVFLDLLPISKTKRSQLSTNAGIGSATNPLKCASSRRTVFAPPVTVICSDVQDIKTAALLATGLIFGSQIP
jgi:hypothetical protein